MSLEICYVKLNKLLYISFDNDYGNAVANQQFHMTACRHLKLLYFKPLKTFVTLFSAI